MGGNPGRIGGQTPLTIWVILVSYSFILKSQLLHLQNKNNTYLSGFWSSQQSLSEMIYGRVVLQLDHTSKSPAGPVKFGVDTLPSEFLIRSGVGQESLRHRHITIIIIICILFLSSFQAMWKLLVQGPFFENH